MAKPMTVDQAALAALLKGPDGPVADEIRERTEDVRGEAIRLVGQPGTVPDSRAVTGMVSKPGDPPARQTGDLQASIRETYRQTPDGLVGRVTAEEDYGRVLELGGRNVAPRPFLRPALRKARR